MVILISNREKIHLEEIYFSAFFYISGITMLFHCVKVPFRALGRVNVQQSVRYEEKLYSRVPVPHLF